MTVKPGGWPHFAPDWTCNLTTTIHLYSYFYTLSLNGLRINMNVTNKSNSPPSLAEFIQWAIIVLVVAIRHPQLLMSALYIYSVRHRITYTNPLPTIQKREKSFWCVENCQKLMTYGVLNEDNIKTKYWTTYVKMRDWKKICC